MYFYAVTAFLLVFFSVFLFVSVSLCFSACLYINLPLCYGQFLFLIVRITRLRQHKKRHKLSVICFSYQRIGFTFFIMEGSELAFYPKGLDPEWSAWPHSALWRGMIKKMFHLERFSWKCLTFLHQIMISALMLEHEKSSRRVVFFTQVHLVFHNDKILL